jgi:hypothetical protein
MAINSVKKKRVARRTILSLLTFELVKKLKKMSLTNKD